MGHQQGSIAIPGAADGFGEAIVALRGKHAPLTIARRYGIEWIYAHCGPGALSGSFHCASGDLGSRGNGPELSKIEQRKQ